MCHQLQVLIDASIELNLRIELAADGLLLGHRGGLPATELLELVLDRRRAFNEFLPRSHWRLPFPGTGDKKFEVSDGVWGYSRHNVGDPTFRSLKFEEMSPPNTTGGRWELSRDDLGFDVTDLAFWLDADALFLIEKRGTVWRIHFRELSTNDAHPMAFQPFFDIHQERNEIWAQCEIVSYEERLSVEFFDTRRNSGSPLAAVIFDWTTGMVLLPYTVVNDLAFLTKGLVVLAKPSELDGRDICLEVRSLGDREVQYICKMPRLAYRFHTRFLKRPASNQGANCPTQFSKMFLSDPVLNILAMVFYYRDAPSPTFTVVLAIHPFLRKCQQLADEPDILAGILPSMEECPVFEWGDWGPSVTRWLPTDVHAEYGSRMLYGSKMLAIYFKHIDGNTRVFTAILDFNPRAIRRSLRDTEGQGFPVTIVDKESEWVAYSTTAVSSALPYRMFVSDQVQRYLNLFMDSNTIVGRLEDEYHFFSFLAHGPTTAGKLPPRML